MNSPANYTARLAENVVQRQASEVYRTSLQHFVNTLNLPMLDDFICDASLPVWERAVAVRRFDQLIGEPAPAGSDGEVVARYLSDMDGKR